MIEKFTEEELRAIIKDLRAVGYDVKQTTKQMLMKEEAGKIFEGNKTGGKHGCYSVSGNNCSPYKKQSFIGQV